MFKNQLINLKRSKMENNQITIRESLYLIYSYVSISAFLLMAISKVTKSLEKALYFNPIVAILIVLNMGVFISFYYYKKTHSTHGKHNHL